MDQTKANKLLESLKPKEGEPPNPLYIRLQTALQKHFKDPESPTQG